MPISVKIRLINYGVKDDQPKLLARRCIKLVTFYF